MKKNNVIQIIILQLCLYSCLYAQEAIPATGGEASGAGGNVSYTVGQVLYNTYTGPSNSEAQGVQQPYEISIVVGIEVPQGIQLHCKVFPNPSTSYLQLEIENYDMKDLQYQLFDITGKLLQRQAVRSSSTVIDMQQYATATYLLHVIDGGNTVQTFKIIKNEK